MSAGRRAVIEVALAAVALVGAVVSGLSVSEVVTVAPIIEGEPATTSVVFRAPWLSLTLLLVTAAGVLIVLAVARWRRGRDGTSG
ncbi:MAG: hypothetical protein ABWY45_08920 [Mycobacterium sp.]